MQPRRGSRERLFWWSSGVLLLLTAAAKLYSSTGSTRILAAQDQLLHVNTRLLMIGVAVLEIEVALYLLMGSNVLLRAVTLFGLSSNFMVYRLGNAWLGIKYCPCLGTVGQRLPLTQAHLNLVLTGLVLYWFVGSSYILWRAWAAHQDAEVAALTAARLNSVG